MKLTIIILFGFEAYVLSLDTHFYICFLACYQPSTCKFDIWLKCWFCLFSKLFVGPLCKQKYVNLSCKIVKYVYEISLYTYLVPCSLVWCLSTHGWQQLLHIIFLSTPTLKYVLYYISLMLVDSTPAIPAPLLSCYYVSFLLRLILLPRLLRIASNSMLYQASCGSLGVIL